MWVAARYSCRVKVLLEQVTEATEKIAQGQFDINFRIATGDEVESLASAVKRMADDLKTYRAELVRSAKMAAIGEMASEVSHEIQNRISGVSLWIQYLDTEFDKDDPRREYLEEMKQGLQGFTGLLNDLKQFYKTPLLQLSDVNLNELVSAALPHVEERVKKRGIEVELRLTPEPLSLKCDYEKIKSVVLNLLINAVDAVEDGGRIEIETRAVASAGSKALLLSVKDNGCGIGEADLPRIFYPFYSTKGSGSGLGLAIASNLVAAQRGKIEVASAHGQGSTFTVVFNV